MQVRPFGILKAIALGIGLSVAGAASASAGAIKVTWDPSATGDTTAGTFTFDRFGIDDWATIDVPANPAPAGSITESGFLEINGFNLGGTPESTVHTVGAGGYGIFEQFTTTSQLPVLGPCTPTPPAKKCAILTGSFNSISAKVFLYSTVHGLASFPFVLGVPKIDLPKNADPVLLATETGPLDTSPNTANITLEEDAKGHLLSEVPGASVDSGWTDVFAGGFFVNPGFGVGLDLDQAFTNTTGVITKSGPGCTKTGTDCTYEIHGGGGNGDFFAVPEPASIALLGAGLIALGVTRRRRT